MAIAEWISLNKLSGDNGTTRVTITASTYQELVDRTTSFNVSTRNTNLSETVNIRQLARVPAYFSVTPNSISYNDIGGDNKHLFIYGDADWTLVSYPDWVNIRAFDGSSETSITGGSAGVNYTWAVTNIENTGETRASQIVFECDGARYSVSVTQSQYVPPVNLSVNPSALYYEAEGGLQSFVITSDGDWFITSYPEWCTPSVTLGSSGRTDVVLNVVGNTGDERNGQVVITGHRNSVTLSIYQETDSWSIYRGQYLTIENPNDRDELDVSWRTHYRIQITIEYSLDSGTTWTSITPATVGTVNKIVVNPGQKVLFRGNNDSYYTDGDWCYFRILHQHPIISFESHTVKIYGNIMSLVYGDDFANNNTLPSSQTFRSLFSLTGNYEPTTVDARNLILPATVLTDGCYYSMFNANTQLVQAPRLPATTLAGECYAYMFQGCTNLTTAPQLPATTLAGSCYNAMFAGCSSLTQAPVLPATTLVGNCYGGMFMGCSSLTQAPRLPATTLVGGCYRSMFYSCTSLNYIKCLATDISASNCTDDWTLNVPSTGTFVKAATMNDWTTGIKGIPEGWTVQNNS